METKVCECLCEAADMNIGLLGSVQRRCKGNDVKTEKYEKNCKRC